MGDFAKDINSKFENNRIKAMLNILYTANYITSYQNDFFKTYGLSPQQYNILRILRGAKRLTDKLCDKKLISRIAFPEDRRVVLIEITKSGLDLLDKIKPNNPSHNLIDKLTEDEAGLLSDLLDKMR